MNNKFKSKEAWEEWHCHWRKKYKAASKVIRHYKNEIKHSGKSVAQINHIRSLLKREQMLARCLMISLESVKLEHEIGFVAWAKEKNEEYSARRLDELKASGRPLTIGRSVGAIPHR